MLRIFFRIRMASAALIECILARRADEACRILREEQLPIHMYGDMLPRACASDELFFVVRELLLRGAKHTDAFFACAEHNSVHCCKLLLTHGVPFHAVNHRGRNALLEACFAGHTGVALQLLHAGSDPTVQDADGNNVLHALAASKTPHCSPFAELICALHPSILSHRNRNRQTPLELALMHRATPLLCAIMKSVSS